jgi:hypothetical protein
MEMAKARERKMEAERMVAEGIPKYSAEADLARLGGRSMSHLEPDHQRGAASPLGHGMGSKKMKEGGK